MLHVFIRVLRVLLLGSLFFAELPVTHAQLRIGAPVPGQPVNPGASLEIQAGPYANNSYRGLLLPRVALVNYATWTLAGTPTDGMLVFNTATSTGDYAVGPGVYVWYNYQWNRLTTVLTPTIITALDCLPDVPAEGAYVTSFPLTAANVKQIRIIPGSAGSFRAVTNSANGYQFVATGTFTAAQVGTPQPVALQGSGTPGVGGPTTFTLTVENQSCSFTVNTQTYVDCNGPLTGMYKVNRPLDASNTKQITIVPRQTGEHFLSIIVYTPDIMNYFYFTKTVTFSASQVGIPQTVVLEASGTPKVAGTFRTNVQVFTNSGKDAVVGCYFSITIEP